MGNFFHDKDQAMYLQRLKESEYRRHVDKIANYIAEQNNSVTNDLKKWNEEQKELSEKIHIENEKAYKKYKIKTSGRRKLRLKPRVGAV